MRLFDLCTLPPSQDLGDSDAAPLTLPSFIPLHRHEAIIQYWARSRLPSGFARVEVDWRGALYTNSEKTLNRLVTRQGAANVALIVRVLDPDLDLEAVTREPTIMQFDHVLITCPQPAMGVRLGRLRHMAASVTEHLERAYAALLTTHPLSRDAWPHAAAVCRALFDPVECVEVACSLASMQLEGLAAERWPSALRAGVAQRQLGLLPNRELVALLAVLAGWDATKIAGVLPPGVSAEAARVELEERGVLVGDRLSGWAAWLHDQELVRSLLGPTLPSASRRGAPWDDPLRAVFEALGAPYDPPAQAPAARLRWRDAEASRVTGALDRARWELDRADELTRSVGGKLAAEKLVAVARLRRDEQRHDDAEALYQAALDLDPDCADALAELGWLVSMVNKRHEDGERLLRRALSLRPDHVDTLTWLGELLFYRLERPQEAEGHLRAALSLAPDNVEAMLALGGTCWRLGLADEAERLLRGAASLRPNDARALAIFGHLLGSLPRRFDEAEALLRRATQLAPGYAYAQACLANFLHSTVGRHAEALQQYKVALSLGDPDERDPNLLANYAGLLLALEPPTDDPYVTRGFEVLRDAEQRLLDYTRPQHAETLRLELSFYFYAHQLTPHLLLRGLDPWTQLRLHDEAPERLLPPLQAMRRLLEAGVRSPGFDLSANVEAARRDGHPHADRVALLAQIITLGAPLSLMDGQWEEEAPPLTP